MLLNNSYAINYFTGADVELKEYESLDAAKAEALENMGYTQQSVEIYDWAGERVARSQWWGVEPSQQDIDLGIVLVRFGTSGFYSKWDDELNG